MTRCFLKFFRKPFVGFRNPTPTERTQRAARLEYLQCQLDALTVTLARAHKLRRNKSASLIEAEIKTTRNAIFREGPPA